MRDKTGFFAGVSDSLCCICVYWIIASTMVMADRGWRLGLFWPFAWTLLCALAAALLLKKERSFGMMMAIAIAESLLGLALFMLICGLPSMTFLYVATLCVGAGMASGLPLYYAVKSPTTHSHLSCLDFLLLAFLWLLLIQTGRGASAGADLLVLAALILSVATAVGLRMGASAGKDGTKAILVALLSAVAVTVLILLLIALFSRSGALTGGILHAIGSFFSKIGAAITAFFEKLASLLTRPDMETEAITAEVFMPDMSAADTVESGDFSGAAWLGYVLGALFLAGLAALALLLRKTRVTLDTETLSAADSAHISRIRRNGRWAQLRRRLLFLLTAFLRRDTPPGLLVLLERKASRKKQGRTADETARHFIRRMAPDGRLDELCDDLDRRWYGGQKYRLTAARCRELRQTIKSL